MNNLPNLHIKVSVWVLLLVMLADVGAVTFGDPATIGAPPWTTAIFKTGLAMLGVLLMVFVAVPGPDSPAAPGRALMPIAGPATYAEIEAIASQAGLTHEQIVLAEDQMANLPQSSISPDTLWAILTAQYPQLLTQEQPVATPTPAPDTSVNTQAQTIGNAQFYTIKAVEAYQKADAAGGDAFLQKAKTWANALQPAEYDFSADDPKA